VSNDLLIKAGRGHVERAGDKIKEYVTVFNYVAVELERAPGTPTGGPPSRSVRVTCSREAWACGGCHGHVASDIVRPS
jgi:hypothetical protein